jgi:hypothetical protein
MTTTSTITYHEALRVIADKSKHPLSQLTTVEGKKITVALGHGGNPKDFCDLIRRQHGCNKCVSRCKVLGRLSILDKKGLSTPLFMVHPKLLDNSYVALAQANGQLCKAPIAGLKVLVGSHVGGYEEEEGMEPSTQKPFRHYHVRIPEDKRTEVDAVEAKRLEKAFWRYCPTLLPSLLDTLLPQKEAGTVEEKVARMKTSLLVAQSALSEAVYGDRLLPSLKWLLLIVEYFEKEGKLPLQRTKGQLWLLCAEMLLWTAIHPDGTDGKNAVSPVVQQAHGNLIPLLDKAMDKQAMVKMLNDRMDPRNYQRPTAAPTLGQIQNAMSALGEFSNRVLTVEEAVALPHALSLCSSPLASSSSSSMPSSMAIFKDMLATASSTATSTKKNPGAFAGRCATGATGAMEIRTVRDLVAHLKARPHTRLEVSVRGMADMYVGGTTLAKEKICVPHFWCFTGMRGAYAHKFPDDWAEVVVVHPLYEYLSQYRTVLLVLKNMRMSTTVGNCCFPEFLEPQYRRTCRSAFEEMNRRVHLEVKDNEPMAMGVGICAINDSGKLNSSVSVRVDGREYTLDAF